MTQLYRPLHALQLQPELYRPWYRFRQYAPSLRLQPHVASFWTIDFKPLRERREQQAHHVLPDGCVEIVFDRLAPSGRNAAYVVGLATRSDLLRFTEPRSIFGIQLYSESARALLQSPLSAFAGRHVCLEEVWGPGTRDWIEGMLASESVPALLDTVESELIRRLDAPDRTASSLVYQSMRHMYNFKGNLSVAELASKVSFSERHLRRAFDRELGLSPKELLGIVRFQSVLHELHKGSNASLTDLALTYGYYDQSHFARSFARYYGAPLKRLTGRD